MLLEVFDFIIRHKIKTALSCSCLIKFKNKYSNEELNKIIENLSNDDKNIFEYLHEPNNRSKCLLYLY